MSSFRLLIDAAADGVTNMARDEALLEAVSAGHSPPTVRFYRWDPPTISLGYFQHFAEYEALPDPAGGLAVVRRTTGGGAILHDREWTYAVAVPASHALVCRRATRLYERVHDALIEALATIGVRAARCQAGDDSSAHRGPFFCFARRHGLDVLIGADKLAGSAQRRTPTGVLQHGSIIMARRYPQQPAAAVQEHLALADEALLEPLLQALARKLEVALEPGAWTRDEVQRAQRLRAKHVSDDWLKRR